MRQAFPDETASEHPLPEGLSDTDAARIRDSIEGQVACPFCGVISDGAHAVCDKCTMENSAVARKATKLRIGPWYVLQTRNPAAPGMKWETLLTFVKKGRVRPNSVVRGPTTHQLWRFAAHVKGLSREFGICYSCGGSVEKGANICPHCNRLQEPPITPDLLLETDEPEARLPIYKEISPAEVDKHNSALMEENHSEAGQEAQRKIREQEEAAAREHREAIERERQAVEKEKQLASHERELARIEQEAATREREALAKAKESLEKDRSAIAMEREAARRERDAAAVASREAANAREVAAREAATVREAAARELAAAREAAAAAVIAAATAPPATALPTSAPSTSAPPHEALPTDAAIPATSVWDLGDHDTPRQRNAPTQSGRPSAYTPPAAPAAGAGQKPRARDGFLTAKDLAAAFKLNMPTEGYDIAAQPAEAHHKPEPVIPPTSFPPQQTAPSPKRGYGKIIVVLGLIVVAAAFAVIPDLRQMAANYWNDLIGQSPKLPSGNHKANTPGGSNLPDYPSEDHPDNPASSNPPIAVMTTTRPSAVPRANQSDTPRPVTPAPAPPPVATPSATTPADTAPQIVPQPATPSPSVTAPPEVPADAGKQVQALFRSALDAEGRGDFAAAAGLYDQIEKFPHEYWPESVEIRRKLAKEQADQSTGK